MTIHLNTDNTFPIQAGEIIPVDHAQIEAILFVDTPRESADHAVEIRVALRDGRNFAFTVYTPAALMHIMRESGQTSLVDTGMMLVSAVTLEAVRDALEKMLVLDIARFGLPV